MALTDSTIGGRVIAEGIGAVKVVLSEACKVGDLLGKSGSTWVLADGNNAVSASLIAGEAGASGATITAYRAARIGNLSGATIGRPVYLSDTAGGYSESTGTTKQVVGMALSATEILVSPAELNAEPVLPNEQYETVSTNKTLDEGDNGVIQVVDTDAVVITLPATVVGTSYTVMNGAADGAALVKIAPNASDKVMGNGYTSADNKYIGNTKATAKRGDYMKLVGDGVNGWMIVAVKGTWAKEA